MVTSKPKRISVAAGLVHMVDSFLDFGFVMPAGSSLIACVCVTCCYFKRMCCRCLAKSHEKALMIFMRLAPHFMAFHAPARCATGRSRNQAINPIRAKTMKPMATVELTTLTPLFSIMT